MNRPDILLGGIHGNGEPLPHPHGTDAHDETFEGSTGLYAKHLILDHGFSLGDLGDLPGSADQASWSALNELHRRARRVPIEADLDPSASFWTAPDVTVHNNGETPYIGPGKDPHDQEFEDDNDAFAKHLIEGHGYQPADVEAFRADGGPAGWHTMRNMHLNVRLLPDATLNV